MKYLLILVFTFFGNLIFAQKNINMTTSYKLSNNDEYLNQAFSFFLSNKKLVFTMKDLELDTVTEYYIQNYVSGYSINRKYYTISFICKLKKNKDEYYYKDNVIAITSIIYNKKGGDLLAVKFELQPDQETIHPIESQLFLTEIGKKELVID